MCSQILTVGIQGLKVLIRLVDMGFNSVFSDTHCRYTGPKGFNQIGGHGFHQGVLRYSL